VPEVGKKERERDLYHPAPAPPEKTPKPIIPPSPII